jgi:hypothetical protein
MRPLFYSTDFRRAEWRSATGTTTRCGLRTVAPGNPDLDYRFDTVNWSDLTAGGTKNLGIGAPWNFDAAAGGFLSGLGKLTSPGLVAAPPVANWGEDRNYNSILDPGEDRDPLNGVLSENWGVAGGCGWQTDPAGPPLGGVWHTGTIGALGAAPCSFSGPGPGACQRFETVPGTTGQNQWHELLLTPVLLKVNICTEPPPGSCGADRRRATPCPAPRSWTGPGTCPWTCRTATPRSRGSSTTTRRPGVRSISSPTGT